MITLNLLSPSQKEALLARVRYSVLERTMVLLVAGAVAGALLMTLVKIRLTNNLEGIISRQLLSAQYAAINDRTRQLNDAIVRIEALQKLAYPLSAVVESLTKDAPEGISVTGLDLDTVTGKLQMSGSAKNRETLLAYEQVFRTSPFVKSFESPISNLFQKEDVSFTFQAVIDGGAVRDTLQPKTP